MKIVVAGGKNEADFLISLLQLGKHRLAVINEDKAICERLSADHRIPVIYGDPCKEYILEEAGIREYDVMISLREKDADNLAACQMAKRLFSVRKTVCTVSNPKNVEIFEALGVDRVISATYILASYVEQASTVENIVKVLPLDNQKVLINDMLVDAAYPVVDKKLMDLTLPFNTIISCIIRDMDVIIPNGQNRIMAGDRLLVLSTPDNQEAMIRSIAGERSYE